LTEVAAAVADQSKKLMLTAGAADDATYKKGFTSIYQVYTPASRYLKGAIDLIADLNVEKIAFVYENDSFSVGVVEAAKRYAEVKQYEIVLSEGYDPGIVDFSSLINQIQQAGPDIILGGGHFEDGSKLVRQLREREVDVKLIGLLIAPTDSSFADELGDAAFGVIGPSQWEPKTNFRAKDAEELGVSWYGPTNEDFVKAYKAAYKGEEPSYHAAGGYMAGLILQSAIEQAGTLDKQKIKVTLDKTDFLSFYGRVNFDDSAEAHGLQTGHKMVYVQWQRDSKKKMIKQIIWPEAGKTAEIIYPLP
jgi:branched-chain amino acid transport system substrate-binding protein